MERRRGQGKHVTAEWRATSVHDNVLLVPLVRPPAARLGLSPKPGMTFDLSGQGGLSAGLTTQSPARVTPRSVTKPRTSSPISRRSTSCPPKPYNATFFRQPGSHLTTTTTFFNTVTADGTRYGGRVGWSAESFNVSTDVGYRDLLTQRHDRHFRKSRRLTSTSTA